MSETKPSAVHISEEWLQAIEHGDCTPIDGKVLAAVIRHLHAERAAGQASTAKGKESSPSQEPAPAVLSKAEQYAMDCEGYGYDPTAASTNADSPTPRTDAAEKECHCTVNGAIISGVVIADFARSLEREADEANMRAEQWFSLYHAVSANADGQEPGNKQTSRHPGEASETPAPSAPAAPYSEPTPGSECGGPDNLCLIAEARGEHNRCQGRCAYAPAPSKLTREQIMLFRNAAYSVQCQYGGDFYHDLADAALRALDAPDWRAITEQARLRAIIRQAVWDLEAARPDMAMVCLRYSDSAAESPAGGEGK